MRRDIRLLPARASAFAGLLLAALSFAGPAQAQTALTPHIADYKVKISVLGGNLRTKLSSTANGFTAERITTPTGFAKLVAGGTIQEVSEFSVTADGLRPSRYYSNDEISKKAGETSISFDWDTGEATASHNDQHVSAVLEDLAHDRLSIQYELMYDLLNELPVDSYLVFEVDKLRSLQITKVGTQTVKVPAGKYEAIGIRHQAEGSSRVTTFWCVEELGYLPVIIERHRKGKLQMRAMLKAYTAL